MKDHLAWVTDAKTKEEAMTTKVSDERLALWIAQAPRDSNGELAHEVAMMAVELQEKRALVKECETVLAEVRISLEVHLDELDRYHVKGCVGCKNDRALLVTADDLLARVRGEI